jgi:L-methionine (R)-S-oxide reductase
MAETLSIPKNATRTQIYETLRPQLEALLKDESDQIANLANFAAVIKEAFGFLWVGFYLVKEGQLVLGPFQGPIACTRIPFTKGVCGHAYTTAKTVVVPDVDAFPGHIACSSEAKSEIVVPVFGTPLAPGGKSPVIAVLDVDSSTLNDFTAIDAHFLETFVTFL